MGERLQGVRLLIRDRDSKFSAPFDEVFRTEGVSIVKTPIRAPRANAFAERWVRTVRNACVDWMLVLGRRHLERVLRTYAAHYNEARPDRGLDLKTPEPQLDSRPRPAFGGRVRRHDRLAGLIHEYELVLEHRIRGFRALQAFPLRPHVPWWEISRGRGLYPGDRRAGQRTLPYTASPSRLYALDSPSGMLMCVSPTRGVSKLNPGTLSLNPSG